MTTYHAVTAKVAAKTTTPAYTDADSVLDFSINEGREPFTRYELGDENPKEIHAGKISISGSFSRHFDNTDFSASVKTLLELVDEGVAMHVALFPEGDATPKIDVEDAKFSNWRLEIALDGLVVETVDYVGLSLAATA